MAQATGPAVADDVRRDQWVARVTALVDQVAGWAADAGWSVERRTEPVDDRLPHPVILPVATFRRPYASAPAGVTVADDEVSVTPVAMVDPLGRVDGWVGVDAIPTFSQVRLIPRPDPGDWEIVAGSNVRLRRPWTADTFAQLLDDLVA